MCRVIDSWRGARVAEEELGEPSLVTKVWQNRWWWDWSPGANKTSSASRWRGQRQKRRSRCLALWATLVSPNTRTSRADTSQNMRYKVTHYQVTILCYDTILCPTFKKGSLLVLHGPSSWLECVCSYLTLYLSLKVKAHFLVIMRIATFTFHRSLLPLFYWLSNENWTHCFVKPEQITWRLRVKSPLLVWSTQSCWGDFVRTQEGLIHRTGLKGWFILFSEISELQSSCAHKTSVESRFHPGKPWSPLSSNCHLQCICTAALFSTQSDVVWNRETLRG